MNYYFNDKMFNQNYVNPEYYNATMKEMKYSFDQDKKVADAVKAMHDLCEAVKGMDREHQEIAFVACLSQMAKEMNW